MILTYYNIHYSKTFYFFTTIKIKTGQKKKKTLRT